MELTRRNFFKLGSAGALAVAGAGMTACSPSGASAQEEGTLPEFDIPGRPSMSEIEASSVIIDELTADTEETYDIVVIGAGTSGIPAAIAAAQNGASVCVLQKEATPVAQGATVAYIDKSVTDDLGISHLIHTMREILCYRSKWDLNALWARNCTEAVEWITGLLFDAGLTEKDMLPLPGATYEYPEGIANIKVYAFPSLGGIGGVIEMLAESYADLMTIKFNTPAVQLIKEGERVVGVFAEQEDGSILRVNANKGIVLATGDYQNNNAMVEKYVPDAIPYARKQNNKTGDGHLMGMLVGAKMQNIGHSKMIHSSNAAGTAHDFQSTAFLAINKNGERFCAEDAEFTVRSNIVLDQPDHAWISILDSKNPMPLEELEERNKMGGLELLEGLTEADGVFKANTIEELAEAMGLPVDTTVATVKRYNELCAGGGDIDFGKPTKFMQSVDQPPYYGLYKEYQVAALTSGLEINADAQVLSTEETPIEGLYAIGNCSGPFYACPDYPMDIPALSVSRCMTFGYMVGKRLATA